MLEKISNDIIIAMKSKDVESLNTLRLLKGAIQLEVINNKAKLEDSHILSIIVKQVKTRKDSIIEFEKGNRKDLIDKTNKEIEILQRYLPEQLSDQELNEIIDEIIGQVNAKTISDIGKIMGILIPKIKGKADMTMVNTMIKEKLN